MCLAILLFCLPPLFFTTCGDIPLLQRQKPLYSSPCSPNSVFPQGTHKSCCFTSYCHCSHRHVSALVPEPEREARFLVPVLAARATSAAPPASPSTVLLLGSNQSCSHLSSGSGEEMGLCKWGAELSWGSSRGALLWSRAWLSVKTLPEPRDWVASVATGIGNATF